MILDYVKYVLGMFTNFFLGAAGGEEGPRRGPGGDRKAPWSPPQRRKLLKNRKKKVISFPCLSQEISCGPHPLQQGGPRRGPGGDRKAPWSPPQRRNPLRNEKSKIGSFPSPSTRNLFLVGGFARLRADEVLSHTGKYPKGAGGGQRVHGTWPPPDPPLLSYNAPLASQGRAQLGSRPSLGGPLSPSRLAFTS